MDRTEGRRIVTVDGWTVYLSKADEPTPSKANCVNECLAAWAPVLTDGSPIKVGGILPALVGTVVRRDGYVQVTLKGWPLYRSKADMIQSDVSGIGEGWSVVRLDGRSVTGER